MNTDYAPDLQACAAAFEKKGYDVRVFENVAAANAYFEGEIKNSTVGIGGSVTVRDMGLAEVLDKTNQVFWHWRAPAGDKDVILKAKLAENYILSANAITEKGEIVNIDANGNRVSASCHGAKNIYFVCGINKISPNLEAAIFRAKNIAAPLNSKRLNRKTPCAVKGDKCYNCASPERICRVTSIMTYPVTSAKNHLILISQKLGY